MLDLNDKVTSDVSFGTSTRAHSHSTYAKLQENFELFPPERKRASNPSRNFKQNTLSTNSLDTYIFQAMSVVPNDGQWKRLLELTAN